MNRKTSSDLLQCRYVCGSDLHCIEAGGVAPSFVITPNANEKYAISVNVMRFP